MKKRHNHCMAKGAFKLVVNENLGVGIVVVLACIFMLLEVIGMGFSFLFLWSSSVVDVTGDGMGFICGSILLGASLISLAIVAGNPVKAKREGQE